MMSPNTHAQSPLKRTLLTLGMLALALSMLMVLSGCGNDSDQQRIAELEAQVQELQGQQDDAASTQGQPDQPSSDASATADQVQSSDATIQDLAQRTDDLVARANAAEVPSDANARIDAFFALDSEFNQLDGEIDAYENQKETEYRNGTLSWDDYRALELQLEQIEDNLGNAQDNLELRFGIDD